MAALKAGMPVGPLAIQDEVSLTLTEHFLDIHKNQLQQLYLYGLTHESWCEPLHLQKF
jgi:3-hydroxyacyl-CoA dehydrogenase